MRSPSHQDGYTLLELLVVMSILVTSYVLISPMIIGRSGSTELHTSALQIASQLRLLRSRSIAEGKVLQFEVINDGHAYTVSGKDGIQELASGITLVKNENDTFGDGISFYPDGTSSGINLVLKFGEIERLISSDWPSGKVEVRIAA